MPVFEGSDLWYRKGFVGVAEISCLAPCWTSPRPAVGRKGRQTPNRLLLLEVSRPSSPPLTPPPFPPPVFPLSPPPPSPLLSSPSLAPQCCGKHCHNGAPWSRHWPWLNMACVYRDFYLTYSTVTIKHRASCRCLPHTVHQKHWTSCVL